MNEIFSLMGIGAVSLTLFLTQVAKKYIEIRYIPLVALVLGIIIVSLAS